MTESPVAAKLEQVLLAFLDRASKATSLVEVNVAAGKARNEYLGLDQEQAA